MLDEWARMPGDFQTPEQKIGAEHDDLAWESCMTMNDSWGYSKADRNWKSPERDEGAPTIDEMLMTGLWFMLVISGS